MAEEDQAILPYSDFLIDSTARIVSDAGVICEIPLDLADDVRALKRQIQAKGGIPSLGQHLCIGNAALFDRELLSSIIIMGGIVEINLTLRQPEVVDLLTKVREDTVKKHQKTCLEGASQDLLQDEAFMFAAVQEHRLALRFAPPALKANRMIVKAAVQHSGTSIRFASESLRDDVEIALFAVRQDGWALQYVSVRLQDEGLIVQAAVQQTGSAFEFAGPSLRSDRSLAMLAVRGDGLMLREVDAKLRSDADLVMAAVLENSAVFEFLEPKFRADQTIALAAIKTHHPRAGKHEYGIAMEHVTKELQVDRKFIKEALAAVPNCFRYLSADLRDDYEIAFFAVQRDGTALVLISPELRDFEMSVAAVKQDIGAWRYVNDALRDAVSKAVGGPKVTTQSNKEPTPKPHSTIRRRKDPRLLKHLETLGLKETATPEQVRKRYRELALQTHPDKQLGNPEDAKHQFTVISTAYQAIKEEWRMA